MKNLLQKYVKEYSILLDQMHSRDEGLQNVNNPIVFLFIGDEVKDLLLSLKRHNEDKWQNSYGVFYIHAYQTEALTKEQNLFSIQLPPSSQEQVDKRTSIYTAFYQDDNKLIEYNSCFRQLSRAIADKGSLFSSMQKLNICVITAIDDPANILIQEITLLLKRIMNDSFKSVEADLFALLTERPDDEFAYCTALGISFIKEMDVFQKEDYQFNKDLLVIDGQFKMSVCHSKSLFDLVYLISDKNENGLINSEANDKNVEIISNVLFIKNRTINSEYNEKMEIYNNANFRRSIQGNLSDFTYTSVGFSKIRRPNKAIALRAVYYLFQDFKGWVTQKKEVSHETLLNLFELSEASFQTQIRKLIPPLEKIWDLNSLAEPAVSFKNIKKLSIKEAEEILFGDRSKQFFATRIKGAAEEQLKEFQLSEKIVKNLNERVINNDKYGLYSAFLWTSDSTEINIIELLQKLINETKKILSDAELELEEVYNRRVEGCDFKWSFLPFTNKKNLQNFYQFFYEKIYGIQYRVVELNTKLTILYEYRDVLSQIHQDLREKLEKIEQIGEVLTNAAKESLSDDVHFFGNIPEYYAMIVSGISNQLKLKYGSDLYADDQFMGNLMELLQKDSESLLSRLLSICKQHVLSFGGFHLSFEEELLARAVFRSQDEGSQAHTKDELFKGLYQKLDEHSAIQIDVSNFSQELNYKEKYYFGDFYSQFMKFALHKDEEIGLSKVGCVHEKAGHSVEKLVLMGGFYLKDLYYYRNGEIYYNLYLKNNYVFHNSE